MRLVAAAWILLLVTSSGAGAGQHEHRDPATTPGDLRFTSTCRGTVGRMIDRGVIFLHEFAYDEAAEIFRQVVHSDIDCAIGQWGAAMAQWGRWSEQRSPLALEAGRRAVAAADLAHRADPRERRYVDAVRLLFDPAHDEARAVAAYAVAMRRLSDDYRTDIEAATFAAVAQLQAGVDVASAAGHRRDARALLARAGVPSHPGVVHYTLLAADDPPGYDDALHAAELSGSIFRESPYSLYAPIRVWIGAGDWVRAEEASARSADAARLSGSEADELRALDTLVYTNLQQGRDREAMAIGTRLARFDRGIAGEGRLAEAAWFGLAAIPARIALETGDWAAASRVTVPGPAPGWAVALVQYVRAIGAARSGHGEDARRELLAAPPLADGAALGAAWLHPAAGLAGLRDVATGWTLLAEGLTDAALATLQRAAAAELRAGPVDWPVGTLVSAEESLGEMLWQAGRGAEARLAFARSLRTAPHRLRSTYGAAIAAGGLDPAEAAGWFACVRAQTPSASMPLRAPIEEARRRAPAPGSQRLDDFVCVPSR